MCHKQECEYDDKRLISLNGLYCIEKLKEIIEDAEKFYKLSEGKTNTDDMSVADEIY